MELEAGPSVNGLTPDKEMVFTNLVMYLSPYGVGVGGRDNFPELLVMSHAKKWQQPCSIYYFQANSSFIRKFGIAKDVKKGRKAIEAVITRRSSPSITAVQGLRLLPLKAR